MPVLKDLKSQINNTNAQLASKYRMMSAHNRYNLLFRQTHETQTIHHFAILLFKNYLTIQVGTLQRTHRQYIRYESVLDDTLIGIENLNSGYLTHQGLDPQVLTRYLEITEDNLEETAPEYKPVFTSVYQYYGNSLASFTNAIDDLLLQLPILIKYKYQCHFSVKRQHQSCCMQRHIYVVSLRFEEEPNGDTEHSIPPARRQGGFNSD